MGRAVEAEEALKQQIKALFQKVKPEHREQVLQRLQQMRNNDERASYLRGWTKLPSGG